MTASAAHDQRGTSQRAYDTMSIADLAIVAALIFGWGTLSARLERFDVTAAALGAGMMANPAVPARIRRLVNVESGLRMAPVAVAVALAGARLGWATVGLVAWFGPRGLASVVFALLALEELGSPTADRAVAVIAITVLLSVIAHGATAEPLAARYAKLLAHRAAEGPGALMPDMPDRRLIRRSPAPRG